MKIKKPISAGEVASILAVWAVAIIGSKNALSAWSYNSLPQYFTDLMRGDSPLLGISEQFSARITITFIASFIIFNYYDGWIKILNRIGRLFESSLKNVYAKCIYVLFIIIFSMCMLFIHGFFKVGVLSIVMVLVFGSVFISDRLAFTAKFSLIPSFILIFLVLVIPQRNIEKTPYIISTTCEGLKTLKVMSAIKVGSFVKVTTESDTFLININTITRVLPIEESTEGAAKTPQPVEQK